MIKDHQNQSEAHPFFKMGEKVSKTQIFKIFEKIVKIIIKHDSIREVSRDWLIQTQIAIKSHTVKKNLRKVE